MPELPEMALMAATINHYASHTFHSWTRSAIPKLGVDLPFPRCWLQFRLQAQSRGKELRLDIWPTSIDPKIRKKEEKEREQNTPPPPSSSPPTPVKASSSKKKDESPSPKKGAVRIHPPNPIIPLDGPLPLLLRMGMTGHIQVSEDVEDLHKHAHLTFFSSSPSPLALSWVDQRRFGRWIVSDQWDKKRSPCPYTEYSAFRRYVLEAVRKGKAALNKPIGEVLLNQQYFNGIGNYLRAEICYRAGINPFQSAMTVLQELKEEEEKRAKGEVGDVLRLCYELVPEVLSLQSNYWRGKGDKAEEEEEKAGAQKNSPQTFRQWLRCYKRKDRGMVRTVDSKGRTLWHDPAFSIEGQTQEGQKKRKKGKKKSDDEEDEEEEDEAEEDEEEEDILYEAAAEEKKAAKIQRRGGGPFGSITERSLTQASKPQKARGDERKAEEAEVKEAEEERSEKMKSRGGKGRGKTRRGSHAVVEEEYEEVQLKVEVKAPAGRKGKGKLDEVKEEVKENNGQEREKKRKRTDAAVEEKGGGQEGQQAQSRPKRSRGTVKRETAAEEGEADSTRRRSSRLLSMQIQ